MYCIHTGALINYLYKQIEKKARITFGCDADDEARQCVHTYVL